jgi:gamma-glutamyltranspeptidase/glutathione hydrolase
VFDSGDRTINGGCVATTDPRSALAGAEIFQRGGNAADAAVASAFAACVAEFSLVSIGGAGIATVRPPARERAAGARDAISYDFFSVAPGLGRPAPDPHDLELLPVTIDFGVAKQTFHCGSASAAVPGLVAGLGHIWKKHGRLPWAELLQPAVRLAKAPLTLSGELWEVARIVASVFEVSPETRAVFLPDGRFDNIRGWVQADLATTLERLAEAGADDFYRGDIARQFAQDQKERGGLITPEDLSSYQVLELEPRKVRYRDAVVALPPGPSWGGRLIAYALALLADVDLAAAGRRTPDYMASLAEVMRAADRARREHSRDLDALADPEVIEHGRAQVRAALRRNEAISPVDSLPGGMPCTSQISAVDPEGMAVAITISTGVGSGTMVRGTGILLNNMLGEQDLNPDGFHKRPPGARMSTMMSPCIVERPNGGHMALGSAGSNRIRSAVLQAVSNWVDFGLSPHECVNNPRMHFENDILQVEEPEVGLTEQLIARGYEVIPWPKINLYFGGANAARLTSDGTLSGSGDRRRQGACELVLPKK